MKPSEKMRNFTLEVNNSKFQSICWIVVGMITAIIGVVILCILGLNNVLPKMDKSK